MEMFIMGGTRAISHMIFIDDLLIFTKANGRSLHTIKHILEKYATFSRLQTNPSKSSIYFFVVVQNKEELELILNYPIKKLPLKHLGIPLRGRDIHATDCNDTIDQL